MNEKNNNELMTKKQKALSHQAYNVIKSKIMNRDYKPGQYITDKHIENEMNISRTPIREALFLLEHEGFLSKKARRGWKINTLSLDDINQIFEIREVLEGLIARKAAECHDENQRTALKACIKRMKLAAEAKDHDAWRKEDLEMYNILYTMSHNARASQIIRNINDHWHKLRIGLLALEGRIERSTKEHENIALCILSGDVEKAENQMREHTRNIRQEVEHLLVHLILPFTENGV